MTHTLTKIEPPIFDDWIACDFCGGHGLVQCWDSEWETVYYDECVNCAGSGGWRIVEIEMDETEKP